MTSSIRWSIKPFDELTAAELYDALTLRQRVFVVEQNCPYLDTDGHDADAWHLFGRSDGVLVAYARIFGPGKKYDDASIGRVISAPEVRGTGVGRALMQAAIAECARLAPGAPIRISAQAHLERFYSSLGFRTVSDPYDEDGIPHVEMVRRGRDEG